MDGGWVGEDRLEYLLLLPRGVASTLVDVAMEETKILLCSNALLLFNLFQLLELLAFKLLHLFCQQLEAGISKWFTAGRNLPSGESGGRRGGGRCESCLLRRL